MKFKRQSRCAIATDAEILSVAKEPVSSAFIMRKCRLSYEAMRKKVGFLCECGLLMQHDGLFVSSELGLRFVRAFWELESLYMQVVKVHN